MSLLLNLIYCEYIVYVWEIECDRRQCKWFKWYLCNTLFLLVKSKLLYQTFIYCIKCTFHRLKLNFHHLTGWKRKYDWAEKQICHYTIMETLVQYFVQSWYFIQAEIVFCLRRNRISLQLSAGYPFLSVCNKNNVSKNKAHFNLGLMRRCNLWEKHTCNIYNSNPSVFPASTNAHLPSWVTKHFNWT